MHVGGLQFTVGRVGPTTSLNRLHDQSLQGFVFPAGAKGGKMALRDDQDYYVITTKEGNGHSFDTETEYCRRPWALPFPAVWPSAAGGLLSSLCFLYCKNLPYRTVERIQ